MYDNVFVENSAEDQQKFIFGQNMEDRVVNVVCIFVVHSNVSVGALGKSRIKLM